MYLWIASNVLIDLQDPTQAHQPAMGFILGEL